MTTNDTQTNLNPSEVADIATTLDRLAQADRVAPIGMEIRIAAAAQAVSLQNQSPVAGRIIASSGRSSVSQRQWAMAATVLIGFGIGFAVLSRLAEPTAIPSEPVATAAIVAQDMESWLALTESKDETFHTAVQQLATDASRVTESVTTSSTTTIDGDSL
jgi:hypothetical protein